MDSGGGLTVKNMVLISAAVVVIGGAAIWYFGFRDKPLEVTTIEEDRPQVTPVTPYAPDDTAPAPLEAEPDEAVEQIPELENSDPWVREKLTGRDQWLDKVLGYEDLVRKMTVATDLILRDQNPNSQLFFLKPVEELKVSRRGDKFFLAEKSYERFDHAVSIFESLDGETLAMTYKLAQPLFHAAWNELGNGAKWDEQPDRLLERILAVKVPEGEIELFKTGGTYMFADEELEALPALDKAFIRMGPKNVDRIQKKLISIRESM